MESLCVLVGISDFTVSVRSLPSDMVDGVWRGVVFQKVESFLYDFSTR